MTFLELLQQYGVPHKQHGEHEHVSSGWVGFDCPFCSPGWGHFRCGYNLRRGNTNCWVCGRLGLVGVVAGLTGASLAEAHSLVKALPRAAVLDLRPRGTLKMPAGENSPGYLHREFLKRRGFKDWRSLVRLWDLRFTDMRHGHLKWRIIIPVHFDGEVVSWTSRSAGDLNPRRYISAAHEEESVPHKELLYGEDYCRDSIIIVEGPLDVWAGGPGTACTFGTAFSRAQLLKMSRYPRRAVCYDNEPAAQARARKLVDLLSSFPGETFNVVLESGKDISRADGREREELRKRFL